MASLKIIYGIDLGTTNSAIARFENGHAVVKKNDLQMDTTPSCVGYSKSGRTIVGSRARNQLSMDYVKASKNQAYQPNTFIEFKRVMGSDHTYQVPNLGRTLTPEDLSAEVLMSLKRNILDDNVVSAVITVPAMFNNTQKDATKRAAKLAGFEHVELIQEPVAASVAFGLGGKMKNAYWVVFDFGGGTFDAALMKIEDGIMQSIDTAGNNKLGGKDIDQAIITEIIIPHIKENYAIDGIMARKPREFINMWKKVAEDAKIELSTKDSTVVETDLGADFGEDDNGEPLELSLTITRQDIERISRPIFQKAIDITNELLKRNNLDGSELGALILVGGPTYSPIVRNMLREQVTPKVDTSMDPMTCVALGASIYGSMIDIPESVADGLRDRSKVQLAVNYESASVEKEEWVSVALLKDKSDNFDGDSVKVEFVRADGMFTTPMSVVNAEGDVVNVLLKEKSINVFDIRCYDMRGNRLDCEPSQISIIQGVAGLGDAVNPMSLGLGTLDENGVEVYDPIAGLEKSRKLPANGQIMGLRLPRDIRPGVPTDEIRMSIYQMDDAVYGTRALYCQRIYDVVLNGDDVAQTIPAESEINVALHAERSGAIDRFEVFVPALDLTIDLTDRITNSKTSLPHDSFVVKEFQDAKKRAYELNNQAITNRLSVAEQRYNSNLGDRDTAEATVAELQSIGREIDRELALGEWDRQEKKLRGILSELNQDNRKYGNMETTAQIEDMRREMERVIATRNVQLAKDLYYTMWNYDFRLAEVEFYIAWLKQWDHDFDQKRWTNVSRARELVSRGVSLITPGVKAETLKAIVDEIMLLLPESQRPNVLKH